MTIKTYEDYKEEILPKYHLIAFSEIISYCKNLRLIEEIYTPSKAKYDGIYPIVIVKFKNDDNLYEIPLNKLVSREKQRKIISNLNQFIPMKNINYSLFDYTKCVNLTKLNKK